MKNFGILLFLLIAIMVSGCGKSKGKHATDSEILQNDTGKAVISFREYEYNFGKVTEGEKIGHAFIFINEGTGSLVITSATTSCGCTVPEYEDKPIPPGGNGTLEVVFDTSGRNGIQTKTISVKSNATIPIILLKITAEVVSNNNQ
jgi:hypothetical protein